MKILLHQLKPRITLGWWRTVLPHVTSWIQHYCKHWAYLKTLVFTPQQHMCPPHFSTWAEHWPTKENCGFTVFFSCLKACRFTCVKHGFCWGEQDRTHWFYSINISATAHKQNRNELFTREHEEIHWPQTGKWQQCKNNSVVWSTINMNNDFMPKDGSVFPV